MIYNTLFSFYMVSNINNTPLQCPFQSNIQPVLPNYRKINNLTNPSLLKAYNHVK